MPKELGLFYVVFLTVPVYKQWGQFIVVHENLPTSSHCEPRWQTQGENGSQALRGTRSRDNGTIQPS